VIRAVFELLLFVGIEIADRLGYIPLSPNPLLLLLTWILLRLRGLRMRDIGLTRPPSWWRAIAIGVVAGVALELFSTFVTVPLLARITGAPPELSDFRPLVGNLRLLLLTVVPMWVLAAFGEEVPYRGYLMHRIAEMGRGTRGAWIVSLIVVSAYFGWVHGDQQLTGMLQESIAGLVLGVLFLACRRNLTVPIIAHGVSNTVAFVLIYLGRYPGV
jgi:membrane protease YdiL (CAAX protease family)